MTTVKICARQPWNDTGIRLEAGKAYRFSATGNWDDWFVTCGVEGYSKNYLKPFETLRRVPHAQWFSLIGSCDKDPSSYFDLGYIIAKQGGHYRAKHTGELCCFANDMPGMYWNNHGCVELHVQQEN
jgi:hypothetical protein